MIISLILTVTYIKRKMKKKFIYTAALMAIVAASCKEQPIIIAKGTAQDSTYLSTTIQPKQTKHILVDELSGVKCVNCPAGAEKLEELNAQHKGILNIVTIHTGFLTSPIAGKSIQDFTTVDGSQIRLLVLGEEGSKPTAAFDRQKIGNDGNTYLVNVYTNWSNAVQQAIDAAPTTPLNIKIKSGYNTEKNQYDIEVTVDYTEAVTAQQALSIYLTESKIIDVQEYAPGNYDMNFEFNHVFRKSITPPSGIVFLSDKEVKEAGRGYIYRTSFKIDPTDAKEKFWKPENMKVVAFVSAASNNDKHVYHVQEVDLK
jgi:hypothetical protein